jgi:hypothetical protein
MNEEALNRKATGMNEIIQTKHSFRERCAATQYSSNYEPPHQNTCQFSFNKQYVNGSEIRIQTKVTAQ